MTKLAEAAAAVAKWDAERGKVAAELAQVEAALQAAPAEDIDAEMKRLTTLTTRKQAAVNILAALDSKLAAARAEVARLDEEDRRAQAAQLRAEAAAKMAEVQTALKAAYETAFAAAGLMRDAQRVERNPGHGDQSAAATASKIAEALAASGAKVLWPVMGGPADIRLN